MVNARKTDPAMPLMTMFTIIPIGGACALAGILFIVTASRWLLPDRIAFREEIARCTAAHR